MKYILFDLDGTLLNTRDGIVICVQRALASQGVQIDDLDLLERHIGPPLKDGFMHFYNFDSETADAAVIEYRKHYKIEGIKGTKPYEGTEECLHALKEAGYTLLVASSKPEHLVKSYLEHFGLAKYFTDLCGSIEEGPEIRTKKEEVIQYVLKRNQINNVKDVIMVGDRYHDVEGAAAYKIPCVGVLYGFGGEKELLDSGAVAVVSSPKELQQYLMSWARKDESDNMEETMKEYIIKQLKNLVNIPSPSGFTKEVMNYVETQVKGFGYECEYTNRGGLLISVDGCGQDTIGLSAHVDTLGAMVRSIASDGTLNFTSVGGFSMQSIEGHYCKVHTRDGRVYTGTILCKSPSVHCQDDTRTRERSESNMMVRIDEVVKTKEDVQALGINSGDYISFDANFCYTESGFIKSRHLDDKASVAVLLGLLKKLKEDQITPRDNLKILISNYEEVGFGASYIPSEIKEFVAVDMGVIGEDLNGSEYTVSICAKDATGPYDYELTNYLIELAKQNEIDYVVDIFPHYGSDASAALRGGNNIRTALIGQGIHASHGTERTHEKALLGTLNLLVAYVRA